MSPNCWYFRKMFFLRHRLLHNNSKQNGFLVLFRPASNTTETTTRRSNSNSSWKAEITGSEILFRHEMEVPRKGILDLLSSCNTIVKSKYNEHEPEKKEAIITIYGKEKNGKKMKDLKNIIDKMHNFKNFVRHKFTGHPPLLRVEIPYLQKYKEELENCTTLVVEIPYQFGMVAQVKQNANLFIKDFENEYTSGYADLGQIELSKVKSIYTECYSGGDIICKDYILGSGHFWTMLDGGVYMKKLQGVNFALHSMNGNIVTESVYCEDLIYSNTNGDVTTGLVQADGFHFETHHGQLKADSIAADKTFGRIFDSGQLDIVIEKTTDLYLYHGNGGIINVKVAENVEIDLEMQSKSSSISSSVGFEELEKYSDPVYKYQVTKGKLGESRKPWKIENHQGHVSIDKGDWMSTIRKKITNIDCE